VSSSGSDATATQAGGITMLDGAALVTGAAVASVHFREFTDEMSGLTILGWTMLLAAFAWLAVTAAGPFVFLVRRFSRRPEGYPKAGDLLWLAFGLPWAIAALFRSGAGNLVDSGNAYYVKGLFAGLFAASGLSLWQIVRTWKSIGPGAPASPVSPEPTASTWTELIGRTVAIAWPIQLGLGFVVTK
jgi:hypothetical protein